jgi:hypothetical protein
MEMATRSPVAGRPGALVGYCQREGIGFIRHRRLTVLRRHDYDVEINAGNKAAHYVSDYDDVAGIKLPTKHRVFPRDDDSQSLPEPLFVSIDLSEIEFT